MQTEYIIQTAAAKMPLKVKHPYRRVAVLEVEAGTKPAMISRRAKGVVRIIETWENCCVGTTERCAYERALKAARELVATLEAQRAGN